MAYTIVYVNFFCNFAADLCARVRKRAYIGIYLGIKYTKIQWKNKKKKSMMDRVFKCSRD